MDTSGAGALPRPLISQHAIERRVAELAAAIDADYHDCERLVCIGVLKGAVFFLVDLLRRLRVPVALDFLQTSSYRSGARPGDVRVLKDVALTLRDRDVLLVEDIVDTGRTLRSVLDLLRVRRPRSLRLCALLDKRAARRVDVPIDYRGFEIDDLFVVGYGLDVDERFRTLPYIGVWRDERSRAGATEPTNRPEEG